MVVKIAAVARVEIVIHLVVVCLRVQPLHRLMAAMLLVRVTAVKVVEVQRVPLVVKWYLVASAMTLIVVFASCRIWNCTSTALVVEEVLVKELLLLILVKGQVAVVLVFLVRVWISAVKFLDRSFRLRGRGRGRLRSRVGAVVDITRAVCLSGTGVPFVLIDDYNNNKLVSSKNILDDVLWRIGKTGLMGF